MIMKSNDYFRKREKAWQEQQIKDDKKRMAEIERRLLEARDAIQKEINSQWINFADKEHTTIEEAMKRASKVDVEAFSRKAKKYVREKNFSQKANRELRLYNLTMRVNRLELLKSNIGLELINTFNDLDKYFAKELYEAGMKEAERQAGILAVTVNKNSLSSMVEKILDSSFRTKDYPSFSTNLWMYQSELKADLDKLLIRSITGGRNPNELAKELGRLLTDKGKVNTLFNTQRLMVTETTSVQISIQKHSYINAGVSKYEFISEPTACSYCKPLNGKVFDVDKMIPGQNAPSIHPFCRCSTMPHNTK